MSHRVPLLGHLLPALFFPVFVVVIPGQNGSFSLGTEISEGWLRNLALFLFQRGEMAAGA